MRRHCRVTKDSTEFADVTGLHSLQVQSPIAAYKDRLSSGFRHAGTVTQYCAILPAVVNQT